MRERLNVWDKLGFGKKSLIERWTDRLADVVEDATEGLERTADRAVNVAEAAGRRGGSYARQARAQAREASGRVREDLEEVGERVRLEALAGREALAQRLESIAERAAEIRAGRRRRRDTEVRRATARRRPTSGREAMQFDLRSSDRIVLRSRRPIDLRMPDGGMVRYRYYERPDRMRRLYLRLTGRRIWPR